MALCTEHLRASSQEDLSLNKNNVHYSFIVSDSMGLSFELSIINEKMALKSPVESIEVSVALISPCCNDNYISSQKFGWHCEKCGRELVSTLGPHSLLYRWNGTVASTIEQRFDRSWEAWAASFALDALQKQFYAVGMQEEIEELLSKIFKTFPILCTTPEAQSYFKVNKSWL